MKLLYKTTRDYLIASVSILIFTGVTLFMILQKAIGDEMNEQLELQADEIFANARTGNFMDAPLIRIVKVAAETPTGIVFGDSLLYDRIQNEYEEYHYIRETQKIGQDRYQAIVMTSHIGWDQYYLTIFYIFLLTAFLLTGSGVLINYFSNKKIWTPFFKNLKNVQNFSVSSPAELQLYESSINEFKELNYTLEDLTKRSRREYLALREFTENASHEIQTPLSIIQSKLDRMSQLEMSEQMAGYIVQAKSGVDRLAKMNKSLLLLAKLDNNIFVDKQQVALHEILEFQIRNMEDLFDSKKIILNEDIGTGSAFSDKYLAETLISNLLSNALRYTPVEGEVKITLTQQTLSISNTGSAPDFPVEQIFQRFTKSQQHITSTGLGLAISKEICLMNNWDLTYQFEDGWHSFLVKFSS